MITPAYLFTRKQADQLGLSLATGPGSGCADEPEQSHMHIERSHLQSVNFEHKPQSPKLSYATNTL